MGGRRLLRCGRRRVVTWPRVAFTSITLILAAGCGRRPSATVAGVRAPDIERGRALASSRGCAACHTIGGVPDANGMIGPPLIRMAQRSFIAGVLPNTPEQLQRWIRHPQLVKPGNAMPELALTDSDAADLAAFLLTR